MESITFLSKKTKLIFTLTTNAGQCAKITLEIIDKNNKKGNRVQSEEFCFNVYACFEETN